MLGIYVRLSKEDEESNSINNQIREGKAFAESKGYKDIHVYNEGEGLSGSLEADKRPQLMALMSDMKSKRLEAVWFRDQNRLERNNTVFVVFVDLAKKSGVKVFIDGKEYDYNDPNTKLISSIMSSINSFQLEKQSYQTKKALQDNVKDGKAWGVLKYGYSTDENSYLIVNEEEAKVVRRIFNDCINGIGVRTIAYNLNEEGVPTRYHTMEGTFRRTNSLVTGTKAKKDTIWHSKVVHDILKTNMYKGVRKWGDEFHKCPPIIDEEIWDKAQESLKSRKGHGNKPKHSYLLRKKLICGVCSNYYFGRVSTKNRNDRTYYNCSSKRNKDTNCGNKNINAKPLEDFIWKRFFGDKYFLELVKENLLNSDNTAQIEELKEEIEKLNKNIRALEAERKRTVDLGIKGILDEVDLSTALKENKKETEKLKGQIPQKKNQLATLTNANKEIENIEDNLKGLMEDTDFLTKKEIVDKYIKRIYIRGGVNYQAFEIGIEFNLPVKGEYYIMNYEYSVALNMHTGVSYYLGAEPDEPWLFRITEDGIFGLRIKE